ncbi:hypothetical protein AB4144_35190 [Rhizobiaceae sp. 2RAB30]
MSSKTFKIGRDSGTGQFKPVKDAQADKRGSTVERMPKSGYGDTKK